MAISKKRFDQNSLQIDKNYTQIAEMIIEESVFIYPTETIYGIGGVMTPTVEQKI